VESIHIYGSWASRYDGTTGPTPNDVDALVIGTPNRDAVYDAARRSQERLGREVNVTQRTPSNGNPPPKASHNSFTLPPWSMSPTLHKMPR